MYSQCSTWWLYLFLGGGILYIDPYRVNMYRTEAPETDHRFSWLPSHPIEAYTTSRRIPTFPSASAATCAREPIVYYHILTSRLERRLPRSSESSSYFLIQGRSVQLQLLESWAIYSSFSSRGEM